MAGRTVGRTRIDGKPDGRSTNGKHLKRITAKGSVLIRGGKTPTALSKHAWERMHEDLNFDPLAAAVQVAQGKGLTVDHPLLKPLIKTLENWKKQTEKGIKIDPSEFDLLIKSAIELLTDSWVSHELRSKHIIDLLGYIYPKKKAVDVNMAGSVAVDMSIKPMTKTEISLFKKQFNEDY